MAHGKSCVNLDKTGQCLAKLIFKPKTKRREREKTTFSTNKLRHRFNLFQKLGPNQINTGIWQSF